mgnify:CR=1 FL=1
MLWFNSLWFWVSWHSLFQHRLPSMQCVTKGLFRLVQYTFSCSPPSSRQSAVVQVKPQSRLITRWWILGAAARIMASSISLTRFCCNRLQKMPQLTPDECLQQPRSGPDCSGRKEGQLLLLMKYFHFPHMLMLWEFAFGVIIHCLLAMCDPCWKMLTCIMGDVWGGFNQGGNNSCLL